MSSTARQRFTLYQAQGRAQIETFLSGTLFWFFLSSCHLTAAFEMRILEIFWVTYLDQTNGIHGNNLDCEELRNLLQIPTG